MGMSIDNTGNTRASERLLRVPEVAQRLGLAESSVRKFISQRKIVTVRCGRAVRIPVEEVARMISDGWRDAV